MSVKNTKPRLVADALEPTKPPGRKERWTIQETLVWIAYRVDPEGVPDAVWPVCGPFVSPNTIDALAARVARNPRSWPGPDGLADDPTIFPGIETASAYHYRAAAKRWMRRTKLPATELLSKAVRDREDYLSQKSLVQTQQLKAEAALVVLNDAISASQITAWGYRADDRRLIGKGVAEAIPAIVVDKRREIDVFGRLLVQASGFDQVFGDDDGPFYTDIYLAAAEVKRVWPETQNSSDTYVTSAIESHAQVALRTKKRTGPMPMQTEKALMAMLADLRSGKETIVTLAAVKGVALQSAYGVSRNTAVKARERALSAFNTQGNSGKP